AAAVPTVPAGGSAAWNEFLAPKCDAAVTAIAGLYVDFCFINKHVDSIFANSERALFGARQKEDTTLWGRIALMPFRVKTKRRPGKPGRLRVQIQLLRRGSRGLRLCHFRSR